MSSFSHCSERDEHAARPPREEPIGEGEKCRPVATSRHPANIRSLSFLPSSCSVFETGDERASDRREKSQQEKEKGKRGGTGVAPVCVI
jgi:hypothetical protein